MGCPGQKRGAFPRLSRGFLFSLDNSAGSTMIMESAPCKVPDTISDRGICPFGTSLARGRRLRRMPVHAHKGTCNENTDQETQSITKTNGNTHGQRMVA